MKGSSRFERQAIARMVLTTAGREGLGNRVNAILSERRRLAHLRGRQAATFALTAIGITLCLCLLHPEGQTIAAPAQAADTVANRVVQPEDTYPMPDDDRRVPRSRLLPLAYDRVPVDPSWIRTVADGITLELVGVSERHDPQKLARNLAFQKQYPGGMSSSSEATPGVSWTSWRPDGDAFAQPLYKTRREHEESFPDPKANRAVEIAFRVKGVVPGKTEFTLEIPGASQVSSLPYHANSELPANERDDFFGEGGLRVSESVFPNQMRYANITLSVRSRAGEPQTVAFNHIALYPRKAGQ